MRTKTPVRKFIFALAAAALLIGLYQNCSPSFAPMAGLSEEPASLSPDPFTEPPGIVFEGPSPKILEAKILGEVPYPVFLDESGAVTTRDPLISWRFRRIMADGKFKKLGNVLTKGNPSLVCGILESGQPRCAGRLLDVDVSELPPLPEPAKDLVGNPISLFAHGESGTVYFLQLTNGPQWVSLLGTRRFAKIIPFSPKGAMIPNASGQFVLLTTLDSAGTVGFVVHSSAAAVLVSSAVLTANQLSFAPSVFPAGARDIAPVSSRVAALYGEDVVKSCPDRTTALVSGEVSPCWDFTLPFPTTQLWSENPPSEVGCFLTPERHPYCVSAKRVALPDGTFYVQKGHFTPTMGSWATSFAKVSSQPVESIHISTETANFLVTIDAARDAKVLVQQSARLGADLFSRLGYTKTAFEAFTLNFKWIQFGKDVGLFNGRICGPDPTGTRFLCIMPMLGVPDGMPNSMKFMTSFVSSSEVAKFYGKKAPLPRAGRFFLGNDDVVYAFVGDPWTRLVVVSSAPGAKDLRCLGGICQIDFEDGSSRLEEYVEIRQTYATNETYVSGYRVEPLSGAKLPLQSENAASGFGGLTLDERLSVETSLCGISSGRLVCLERVPGQAAMAYRTLPQTSGLVDHRAYFGKPCVISSTMRMSCLVSVTGGLEFREVSMREPAKKFFGTPVYQGVSGRFYGLREISPGRFGDYELRRMPPAAEIANVVLPRTDMSTWQALSSDGEQGLVIEKVDGTCQYRGMDTNDPIGGPFHVDVRRFQ